MTAWSASIWLFQLNTLSLEYRSLHIFTIGFQQDGVTALKTCLNRIANNQPLGIIVGVQRNAASVECVNKVANLNGKDNYGKSILPFVPTSVVTSSSLPGRKLWLPT
jgi:hypothetical protein